MKQGYLTEYFAGVAVKRLSAVEVRPTDSHQHEFNGDRQLKLILGESDERVRFNTRLLYIGDDNEEPSSEESILTWYDARRRGREARGVARSEYRLYFRGERIFEMAEEGDLLVIARMKAGDILAIVAGKDTTTAAQLLWLFGVKDFREGSFTARTEEDLSPARVGYAAALVLDQIGIEPDLEAEDFLDTMLTKFGDGSFPETRTFSEFARNTLPDVSDKDDPDRALVEWMEREELLYRTLERHLLSIQLQDLVRSTPLEVEPYIKAVQSTLQRRKARAGSALENHLEKIFSNRGMRYSRTPVTERNHRPDFIFPTIDCYHDELFPSERLTMLAAKSTCKDRWRQILNEAVRIRKKYLVTLEPSISANQTDEMVEEMVQLVIPKSLHNTFDKKQQEWIMDIDSFLNMTKRKE